MVKRSREVAFEDDVIEDGRGSYYGTRWFDDGYCYKACFPIAEEPDLGKWPTVQMVIDNGAPDSALVQVAFDRYHVDPNGKFSLWEVSKTARIGGKLVSVYDITMRRLENGFFRLRYRDTSLGEARFFTKRKRECRVKKFAGKPKTDTVPRLRKFVPGKIIYRLRKDWYLPFLLLAGSEKVRKEKVFVPLDLDERKAFQKRERKRTIYSSVAYYMEHSTVLERLDYVRFLVETEKHFNPVIVKNARNFRLCMTDYMEAQTERKRKENLREILRKGKEKKKEKSLGSMSFRKKLALAIEDVRKAKRLKPAEREVLVI